MRDPFLFPIQIFPEARPIKLFSLANFIFALAITQRFCRRRKFGVSHQLNGRANANFRTFGAETRFSFEVSKYAYEVNSIICLLAGQLVVGT